jgi:hypothetical protein
MSTVALIGLIIAIAMFVGFGLWLIWLHLQ